MYTILLKQETPTNTNATGTFASFWHVCETLIAALSCSLWDCFWVVKVPTATNATNETRQHGIAWNQTSFGLTNKHFQPKPDLSRNKTPRWTSANQPQNSQSIRKALQKNKAKPAPLERFPHETQWCDSLWFQLFWADLTTTKTRFRSPLLKFLECTWTGPHQAFRPVFEDRASFAVCFFGELKAGRSEAILGSRKLQQAGFSVFRCFCCQVGCLRFETMTAWPGIHLTAWDLPSQWHCKSHQLCNYGPWQNMSHGYVQLMQVQCWWWNRTTCQSCRQWLDEMPVLQKCIALTTAIDSCLFFVCYGI